MKTLAVACLLASVSASLAQGSVFAVPPPSGGDDTAMLQQFLNSGFVLSLVPGATYRISSTLMLTNGSGIITVGVPAILSAELAFNNTMPASRPLGVMPPNGVVIKGGFGANDLRLENFKINKVYQDSTVVAALHLQGVMRAQVKALEIYDFCLGGVVLLDSVRDVSMRRCIIRDCRAASAVVGSSGYMLPETVTPQLTGLVIDDRRLPDGSGGGIDSKFVTIAHNTFQRLRFQNSLYQTPRSVFGATGTDLVRYETDGINIHNRPSDISIFGNLFDTMGEGVDSFGREIAIEYNVFRNCFNHALKFIHGGSDHVVRHNLVDVAGIGCIVAAGSGTAGVGHTFGNVFAHNRLLGCGKFTAFNCPSCGIVPGHDPFHIVNLPQPPYESLSVWNNVSAGSPYVWRPRLNVFFDNLTVTESARHWSVRSNSEYSVLSRLMYSATSPPNPSYINESTSTVFDGTNGNADRLTLLDTDGNGRKDLLFTWNSSGYSRLYRKFDQSFAFVDKPIGMVDINGNPDQVVAGDFNNDGMDDVVFYWQAVGTLRLFNGTASGVPAYSGQIVAPGVTFTVVKAGDFNSDGKDDLVLWDRLNGPNLTLLGGVSGFLPSAFTIGAGAINGADDLLVGDFDGDGRDDLLFLWRSVGQNRFFFSESNGTYTPMFDPIPTTSVNGGATEVWANDVDRDGASDLNLLWSNDVRRAFRGKNRTFVMD